MCPLWDLNLPDANILNEYVNLRDLTCFPALFSSLVASCYGPNLTTNSPQRNSTKSRHMVSLWAEFFRLVTSNRFIQDGSSMDTIESLEPLLDTRSVARILGVHPQTVLRLARVGILPAIRYARHWRFRKSDIVAWLETQASVPAPPQSVS